MSRATTDALRQVERWFVRRGIPHFIADYSATRDIFTRAAPLLTFVFLAEMFSALNFESWWANVLAVIGAFLLLIGIWAAVNRWRRRPALERPTSIGPIELAVFVLAPPLVPGIFGGDFTGSLALIVGNLALLAVVYVATSYGVVPIVVWASRQLFRSLGGTIVLFARAVPLLLLFVTFLFINAEVWQVSAGLDGRMLAATVGLFGLVAAVFVIARLPREIADLAQFDSWQRINELCADTPASLLPDRATGTPPSPPLDRTQWANVGLVVVFGQVLQLALVASLVFGFLVILGLLVMSESVITSWTQAAVEFIGPEFTVFGRPVRFSRELLQVSGFLAAFSGLYFAVTAVTDAAYREEFFEDVVGEVRRASAVRIAYLSALDRQ
jgi:hypothetical protein